MIQLKDIERIKLSGDERSHILGGALQVGGISMFMGDLAFTISGILNIRKAACTLVLLILL